ncbi:putative methyltransferase-domain-containing protein [Lipomyces chichibuensis]|uniref:putative methyltransferase-domain-containing protein n=1 Tax=Lipomyces chichibuensis TaxID=1546026 RepID=UPI0033441D8D
MRSLKEETISFIRRQFLQQVGAKLFQFALPSVASIATTEREKYEIVSDLEVQHELYIELCESDNRFKRPPIDYIGGVVKRLVLLLEHLQVDISDDIISYMLFAMANTKSQIYFKAPTTPQFGEVTYLFGKEANWDDKYITIQENRNVISGFGTTGYRTWEAALALGEYILSQKQTEHSEVDVVGKRILEVGAGTGFVSLLCGKLGAAKVFGTDGFEDIVLRLRRNIEDNELGNVVETRVYKWGNSSGDDSGHLLERESREADYKYTESVDLILGADITFDTEICELLVKSLDILMTENPHAQVIISATIRSDETITAFEKFLDRSKIGCTWIPALREPKFFFYTANPSIRIYFLHRSRTSD